MLHGSVLTDEEKHKNFFEADQRIARAVSEIEHLRLKGLRIRDICGTIRDIFDHTQAADMVAAWDLKKTVAPDRFASMPDLSEAGLASFVSAICDELSKLHEAQEEYNRLRGVR